MKPGLTKKQRAKLGSYMREIADRLNLRDWTINLLHEPIHSSEYATAQCESVYGRRWADISFCGHFAQLKPELQREVIVHELLHCHIPARRDGSWHGLQQLLGMPAYTVFSDAMNQELEHVVDAIANAIAPMLPLPPKL